MIDEAQGLVDPSKPFVDGSQANSWRRPYGPQAWHIFMQARLTIFFMDADQGYRQVESTKPDDIEALCREEGIPCTLLTLGDEQFRVSGGRAFVDWLNDLLGFNEEGAPLPQLTADESERLRGIFSICDRPDAMRDRLRSLHDPRRPRAGAHRAACLPAMPGIGFPRTTMRAASTRMTVLALTAAGPLQVSPSAGRTPKASASSTWEKACIPRRSRSSAQARTSRRPLAMR